MLLSVFSRETHRKIGSIQNIGLIRVNSDILIELNSKFFAVMHFKDAICLLTEAKPIFNFITLHHFDRYNNHANLYWVAIMLILFSLTRCVPANCPIYSNRVIRHQAQLCYRGYIQDRKWAPQFSEAGETGGKVGEDLVIGIYLWIDQGPREVGQVLDWDARRHAEEVEQP